MSLFTYWFPPIQQKQHVSDKHQPSLLMNEKGKNTQSPVPRNQVTLNNAKDNSTTHDNSGRCMCVCPCGAAKRKVNENMDSPVNLDTETTKLEKL